MEIEQVAAHSPKKIHTVDRPVAGLSEADARGPHGISASPMRRSRVQ